MLVNCRSACTGATAVQVNEHKAGRCKHSEEESSCHPFRYDWKMEKTRLENTSVGAWERSDVNKEHIVCPCEPVRTGVG